MEKSPVRSEWKLSGKWPLGRQRVTTMPKQITLNYCRNKLLLNYFSYSGAKCWNDLPTDLKSNTLIMNQFRAILEGAELI